MKILPYGFNYGNKIFFKASVSKRKETIDALRTKSVKNSICDDFKINKSDIFNEIEAVDNPAKIKWILLRKDENDETLLSKTIKNCNMKELVLFFGIASKAKVNSGRLIAQKTGKDGENALVCAVKNNDIKKLNFLMGELKKSKKDLIYLEKRNSQRSFSLKQQEKFNKKWFRKITPRLIEVDYIKKAYFDLDYNGKGLLDYALENPLCAQIIFNNCPDK